MICFKDMTFCSQKDCPNVQCQRNLNNVPWDKLPKYMGVAVAEFCGKFAYCPKNMEVQEDE